MKIINIIQQYQKTRSIDNNCLRKLENVSIDPDNLVLQCSYEPTTFNDYPNIKWGFTTVTLIQGNSFRLDLSDRSHGKLCLDVCINDINLYDFSQAYKLQTFIDNSDKLFLYSHNEVDYYNMNKLKELRLIKG